MPFTLTLYVLLIGAPLGAPPREVKLPVSSMWECMGKGAELKAAAWLVEHPKYRYLRTTCRIGTPAIERAI
jgi:hypothetical protein